jgi:hypothetical protein
MNGRDGGQRNTGAIRAMLIVVCISGLYTVFVLKFSLKLHELRLVLFAETLLQ